MLQGAGELSRKGRRECRMDDSSVPDSKELRLFAGTAARG